MDKWDWSLSDTIGFSVKDTRININDHLLPASSTITRWNNLVPKKVNILVWRTLIDRIPTRYNLSNKGIDIPSILCPLCSTDLETTNHLFLACKIANKLWRLIATWLDIPTLLLATNLEDALLLLDNMPIKVLKKNCIEAVLFCMIWVIWKHRNEQVFSSGQNRPDFLFDSIVSQSYLWATSRSKKLRVSRDEWFKNPFSLYSGLLVVTRS
uniref:uncharacterized protein LOC122610690 n=1 Tax=Erigeron canadensis TaxID=72917 RepID=UPI001CB9393F|nr:uncharacterized protein LOC122610690 [Erigeron canadensis]